MSSVPGAKEEGQGGSPLRILMTADTVGGVWTYATELAAALKPDAEVVLATMGAPLSVSQWRDIERLGIDVHESVFKLEWMEDPWHEVEEAGQWLLELERQVQPDMVHLNNFAHGALPWQCPSLVVGHSCVYSWWRSVQRAMPPESWGHYFFIVRRGLHAADRVVAPSRAMLRELQDIYGVFNHASVIYNGRTADQFSARQKEPFIFCAARLWDEAKNAQALCKAAKKVRWPVYVAGETTGPGGVSIDCPGIRTLGRVSSAAVCHWMSRAGIYALPARYEPFGLSVLEAALSGCALVLGDIPSLREIWGEAAEYVDPEDPRELAARLNALLDDEPRRKRLSKAAQKRAASYSASAMALHYLSLYRHMIRAQVAA